MKLVCEHSNFEKLDTQMKEGSGGKYLSNEIFYRVSLARERWKKDHLGANKFPTGHFHVAWIQIQVFLKLDLNDEYTVYRYKNNGKIDWYAPSIDSGRTIKDELKTLIKTVEDRIKKGIENYNDENDTILLHYYINGQKQFFDITVYPPTDSVPYTNINLAPNDTMLLKIVVFNNYGFYATENNGKMEECFELIPSDNSSTLNELSPEDNILCYNRTVISNALSTENELNFSKFRVYPNPSSEILKFNYPLKDFKIYDAYGRKVNNYSIIDKFRVDISKIPKGNYFIIGRFKQHLLKRIIIIQ